MKTDEQLKAIAFDTMVKEAKELEAGWNSDHKALARTIRLILADALMRASQ
jgi:hypothetical protein